MAWRSSFTLCRRHLLLRSQIGKPNPNPNSSPLLPWMRYLSAEAPPTTQIPEADAGRGGADDSSPHQFRSSLNEAELAKFAAIAETWWDSEGPFKPLHSMNPIRISFIRSVLCRHFSKDPHCARPFEGLKIIDVGCGGGILSEPLARMGATVTGIDAVEKNINIARLHAGLDPLTSAIDYSCTTAVGSR